MASNFRVASALGLVFLLLLWTWVGGAAVAASHPPTTHALTTSASTVDWVNVTVTDALSFTLTSAPLSANEITPGDTVHVTFTELGTTVHTFTLSSTPDYQFPTSDSTQDLLNYFVTNHPLVNLTVDGTQGDVVTANFTAPTFGEYEYVCLEPGHFTGGMWGILGSGEAGTGAGSAPYNGPGAPVFIISGTITALVIIALVLGFVIGKRRGSTDEMPPERLGYPEPPVPAPLPGGAPPPKEKT
jgi:plastocyanin